MIEPRGSGALARARELWQNRRLIRYLGAFFIRKRYARTWLGWLWLPLRPALDVGARVLIFGGLLGIPSGGVPYLLFFLVGMAAWQLFAETTIWATRSLELGKRFLKRIYLPRLLLPVASIGPSAVNYCFYLVMTAIALVYFVIVEGRFYLDLRPETLFSLAGLLLALGLALSIGLWTSVYGAQARDVRFALRYVLGFWVYLTPVIYPLSLIPEKYQGLASFNPMTAPIEMVKLGLLGTGEVHLPALLVTVGTITIVGGSGLWFFFRSEAAAVDSL